MMHNDDTIQNELKELNSMLAGIPKTNVYTVPDGYFDVLSHDILLAVQQPMPEKAMENVPAGYFDGLADNIMSKIKAVEADENSTLLADVKGINMYQTPIGYFDVLAESILSKIKTEDEHSTLLNAAKGINVYSASVGYFNNLAEDIVNKLPKPAKVFEMKKRSSFFNYAAAAVITGVMGLSVISVFDKKQTDDSISSPEVAVIDGTGKNLDKEFSALSDDAIVNYLKESGEDVNAALVASVSDDKNLPNEEDYILDDKTLDNLLSELKIGETTNN